eukprot:m.542735 g.542735  ORF g.542735 m.542735 type:complete len:53 (+) comp337964_c0_seq1:53-211(+)
MLNNSTSEEEKKCKKTTHLKKSHDMCLCVCFGLHLFGAGERIFVYFTYTHFP